MKTATPEDFQTMLQSLIGRIEAAIEELMPPADARPERIHAAMRYSMQVGGKRLRPALVIAAAEALSSDPVDPLPAAVAIESLHTYSLIHDDLPCVDDSDLRRGKPTSHKQFDEATALLAGDALLNYAFELLSIHYADQPALGMALVRDLAITGGSQKLIGGQMADVLAEKQHLVLNADDLDFIHRNKTAAMLQCSLTLGCRLGHGTAEQVEQARELGLALGMAFQVIDDILDATQSTAMLGKPAQLDAEREKTTYISMHGLDAARAAADRFTQTATDHATALFGAESFIVQLVAHMHRRVS